MLNNAISEKKDNLTFAQRNISVTVEGYPILGRTLDFQ